VTRALIRHRMLAAGALFAFSFVGALAAQDAPRSLTIDEAVASGLASDPGIRSGSWDQISALSRADDAKLRMLPSLTASAGYTQLSPEPAASTAGIPAQYLGLVDLLLGMFSGAPLDSRDVRFDLQYPVFAGFRLREAAAIAKLQSLGKGEALE
jgi:outer membrane protein TolC